jgi:deferrochelatase/peroxidase EfeB
MSERDDPPRPGRRRFFAGAAGAAGAAALGTFGPAPEAAAMLPRHGMIEPFWGRYQGGIATARQTHTYFAAFDLTTGKRDELIALLRSWTSAAARLTQGREVLCAPEPGRAATGYDAPVDAARVDLARGDAAPGHSAPGNPAPGNPAPGDAAPGYDAAENSPPGDSGETEGSPPHRLTLTFGLGAGVFVKDGVDRYGLAARRPGALIDLPRFNGDQLVAERTGGDLCIQACADDPQVAFHAVRQLARLADSTAKLRWAQNGFLPRVGDRDTPRNLMGFKDGTMNVPVGDPAMMERFVWVGPEGGWMQHGSYLVVRPIRMALEHWDRMKLGFQEQVVGRHKRSGAPLGREREDDPLALERTGAQGEPVIPESAHVRLAAPESNDGAQILRRGYSYDNGLSFTAERWPPWRQGMEFDAGLLFVCWQRDPRTGFVKIFERMSKFDMMNQFVTPVGGGLFACPAGATEGGYIGEALFEGA